MRVQTDDEFIASLRLPGADLSAVPAGGTNPAPDLRTLGDLLGAVPDGPRRRAEKLGLPVDRLVR